MASQPPRVTIAKPARPNGVLPVPASATQRGSRQNSGNTLKTPSAPSARQKILIRRLPPGLTLTEFEEALGEEWKTGGDKVDWADYKPGKISKDPAKPSRPSRAYLHVKKAEDAGVLGDKVRSTNFNDAKNSNNDSCLLGPPSVEFAPFQKVPSSRPRKDARQSTIDQDPEFIDFLESLTNPITKSVSVDQENESVKTKEKVTMTPLIQFLRDKKANKGKEASSPAKGGKHGRQDSKESKGATKATNKSTPVVVASNKKRSAQAVKVEQAARDAVKVLNKQAAGTKGPASSNPPSPAAKTTTPNVTPNSTANAALADKKRERGNASAAAKILQRDLGLGGGRGGRGARGGRAGNAGTPVASQPQSIAKPGHSMPQDTSAAAEATTTTPADPPAGISTESKSNPAVLQKPTAPPTGPAAASRAANTPNPTHQKPVPPPSTSTQAFLKHANPSQGITEPLLEEAFAGFGTIKSVEIDKKKGFAYVDFEAPESLQKAIKASPIKVAQGQVQVLERKTGPTLQARNVGAGRGGGTTMGNRGGGMPMNARGGNANIRGGHVRGRGGMGRGGASVAPNDKAKVTAAVSSAPVPSPQSAPAVAAPQQPAENALPSATAPLDP